MKHKCLVMLPLILASLQAATVDDLTFTQQIGADVYPFYIVISCDIAATDALVIPDTYNDLPVAIIEAGAFANCTGLTNIIIPDSVAYIGPYAFSNCTGLTNMVIPDSVLQIQDGTFRDCTGLTNLTIGNNVDSIEFFAFDNCANLTSINIPENLTYIHPSALYRCSSLSEIIVSPNNTSYTSFDNSLFNKDLTALVRSRSDATGINLPSSVTAIGADSYGGCLELTDITIPDTITSIGIFAFGYCSNLTSVAIPNSISSIEAGVFQFCTNLTNVTITESVTLINSQAFEACTSLSYFIIPSSVTEIGGNAFKDCSGLNLISCEANTAPTVLTDWWTRETVSPFAGVATAEIIVPESATGYGSIFEGLSVKSYVLYTTQTMNWSDASEYAQSQGGYLLEINSDEEQFYIEYFLDDYIDKTFLTVNEFDNFLDSTTARDGGGSAYLWLGGSDSQVEGNWRWTSSDELFWSGGINGSSVNNSIYYWGYNMQRNEPDNYDGNQDALALALEPWPLMAPSPNDFLGLDYDWNDINADNELYFIIEKDLAAAETAEGEPSWVPQGWVYYAWPYAYSFSEGRWYFFNELDTQWRVNLTSAAWGTLDAASGWNYYAWPYSYSFDEGAWHWYNNDSQWVVDLLSGIWSTFGSSGN